MRQFYFAHLSSYFGLPRPQARLFARTTSISDCPPDGELGRPPVPVALRGVARLGRVQQLPERLPAAPGVGGGVGVHGEKEVLGPGIDPRLDVCGGGGLGGEILEGKLHSAVQLFLP